MSIHSGYAEIRIKIGLIPLAKQNSHLRTFVLLGFYLHLGIVHGYQGDCELSQNSKTVIKN